MTEEEAEESTEVCTVPDNKLIMVINENCLEPDLANEFRINFEEHFRMANEWSKKSKNIIVTNENQTVLMEQARVARLFIRSKRLEIENFRKSKKEYYLRGGQAIDKVCTFLKNMIEPIENHLDLQEHYIEYKKKAEEARLLEEVQKKMEYDRLVKEKEESEEKERLRIENEKLRKEYQEKERINQEELKKVHQKNEEVLRIERERNAIVERELLNKKQAELKKEADKIRENERMLSAGDEEKLMVLRNNIGILISKLPEVKSQKSIRIISDIKSHLNLAFMMIRINQEEE